MENTQTTAPLHLHFKSQRQVVVECENEERFVLTSRAAAQACRQYTEDQEEDDPERFDEEFRNFLAHIYEWCVGNCAKVVSCYVTVGDAAMNVILRTPSDHYDFDFDDLISDLDLELFNKFPLCRADVLQLPNKVDAGGEVSPYSLVIYGDGNAAGPSGAGEPQQSIPKND